MYVYVYRGLCLYAHKEVPLIVNINDILATYHILVRPLRSLLGPRHGKGVLSACFDPRQQIYS